MITPEDRERFPHHTNGSIQGIKLVESLSDEVLMSINENGQEDKYFKAVLLLMGKTTNRSWIIGRVAKESYDRDLIDEKTFDRLAE